MLRYDKAGQTTEEYKAYQRQYMRAYYWRNPEKSRADRRRGYIKHREKRRLELNRWKQENSEKMRGYKEKSQHKLRNQVLDFFGAKCAYCGYNADARAFQIDHVNGNGNQERKGFIGYSKYYHHILNTNGEGYQLLCANCNQIKKIEKMEDRWHKTEVS